jgi:hypothetical protein
LVTILKEIKKGASQKDMKRKINSLWNNHRKEPMKANDSKESGIITNNTNRKVGLPTN